MICKEEIMGPPTTSQRSEDSFPEFAMIDVGAKPATQRTAWAEGRITMSPAAIVLVAERRLPKGDALALAEMAGIMGAKRTADLLPLCHPIPIDQILVQCVPLVDECQVLVRATVRSHAKTGVEMEALVGVQIALLTLYDLIKAVDPALTIGAVRLTRKEGGKNGVWHHPDTRSEA